jgi:hypothetical protein
MSHRPRQNRVTPLGELVADPARGLVYGNRGCLHDGQGRIRRSFAVRRWIACRLEFRGWHRTPLMQPGRFTELFFLDEATAFAAGHRPCALCRRKDYDELTARWATLHPRQRGADAIDEQLHGERVQLGGGRRLHPGAAVADLPDGAFVLREGVPWLVRQDALLRWLPGGYVERVSRPGRGRVTLVTPPSLVEILRRGWQGAVPLLHPTAGDGPGGRW